MTKEHEPRYPLALTLAQLNDLVPLLDAAGEREGDPHAPIFSLIDLVREARRDAVAQSKAAPSQLSPGGGFQREVAPPPRPGPDGRFPS